MPQPLNPLLYRQLQRLFGHVRIASEGQAMVGRYGLNPITGREELMILVKGEHYRICCPYCTDTRFRCFIHHRWGRRDEKGRLNLWLINCRNEDCFDEERRRHELYGRVANVNAAISTAVILPGEVNLDAQDMDMPGPVTTLDKLPATHPANRYMAGRFYDPERLGRFYGVSYCKSSFWYLAQHRIIAPVYFKGKLKGWQARLVGDIDWSADDAPPKWWSCPNMQKGKLLYNYDNAIKWRTGVLVEGPGDVWGFGPMATGSFGSDISQTQQRLFVSAFGPYSGVLLMDPDVQRAENKQQQTKRDKYWRMYDEMKGKFRHGLASVVLPFGDPGSLDRDFMREYVTSEAKAQGVKVFWTER